MDSAYFFPQTHTSFFGLDDIWVRREGKYSAKMGILLVGLLALAKKPCQMSSDAPPGGWSLQLGAWRLRTEIRSDFWMKVGPTRKC
jgi:hypothetical protein